MDPESAPTETVEETESVEENTPQFETVGELQEWMVRKLTALESTLAELASRPIVEAEALTSWGDRLVALENQTQEQLQNLQAATQTLSDRVENLSMESQPQNQPLETPATEAPPTAIEPTEVPPKSEEESPAAEVPAAQVEPQNPPARRVRLV